MNERKEVLVNLIKATDALSAIEYDEISDIVGVQKAANFAHASMTINDIRHQVSIRLTAWIKNNTK